MLIKNRALTATALTAAGLLALSACGGGGSSDKNTINIVGYSVLQTADAAVIKGFQATDAGKGVDFATSYGASGDQSRAVDAGQKADEVHFSIEPDMTRLVKDGTVDADWNTGPTKGICNNSIVVFVVKKGNPKNITTWADLIKPGVSIVTPNPASSGSAKWNLLAAYGSITGAGGSDADAQAYLGKFFGNVAALPDSGKDATSTFTGGTGDVLLSYENEAILARASGADVDYVIPDSSILIQTPCAVTKDASAKTKDFLAFQESADGQKLYEESGFRPLTDAGSVDIPGVEDASDPFPTPAKLETVDDDFGGWGTANDKYFGDGQDGDPLGIITKIQNDSGKS